jgi:Na+-driven multidrug efflux pump
MMRISAGGVAQFLIATSSWIVLMRIVAYFGSAPVAAYTIALRLAEFSFLPAWGLGNAAATLVGQCLGAGKPGRAERSAWRAVLFNVVFMTVLGVGYVLAAPVVVGWFTDEPEVRRFGIACLQIMGVGYPMYAVGMIIIQALNGAGATGTPSVLNFICFWLIQIPLAWLLATGWNGFDSYGPNGVFISIVVSETLLSLMAVFVFRRGAWKHAKV